MSRASILWVLACLLLVAVSPPARAQAAASSSANESAASAPPPATKLEAFTPAAGAVVTLGYTELGGVSGVSVDVREIRDSRGSAVRGLLVEVTESQYSRHRSFVDADEIPELIKGIDALLEVKNNPTAFKSFEVRYTTRGELQLTTFNTQTGGIRYAVQAGRIGKSQRFLSESDMQKLRAMFVAAQEQLGGARTGG